MSGEDNLLKLVEAEEADENDYRLQEQVGFI
ncbi:MAG: MarR family transcriptional regulator, partial [Mesorhizobium sp.]